VLSISVFSFVFSCKKRTQKSLSRLLVINIYHPQNSRRTYLLPPNIDKTVANVHLLYPRLQEYITVSDVVTCIGVITPVYYPSLVFLADFKGRDFLGLEMYAYMNTHQVQKMPVHTHTRKRECTPWDARNGKKKAKFASNAASHDT